MKTDEIELFKIDGTYRQLTEREEAFLRKLSLLYASDPTQEDIDRFFFELVVHDD